MLDKSLICFLSHSQAVEEAIKTVTAAASNIYEDKEKMPSSEQNFKNKKNAKIDFEEGLKDKVT